MIPETFDTRPPTAAAERVDKPSVTPSVQSMALPAWIMTALCFAYRESK